MEINGVYVAKNFVIHEVIVSKDQLILCRIFAGQSIKDP